MLIGIVSLIHNPPLTIIPLLEIILSFSIVKGKTIPPVLVPKPKYQAMVHTIFFGYYGFNVSLVPWVLMFLQLCCLCICIVTIKLLPLITIRYSINVLNKKKKRRLLLSYKTFGLCHFCYKCM